MTKAHKILHHSKLKRWIDYMKTSASSLIQKNKWRQKTHTHSQESKTIDWCVSMNFRVVTNGVDCIFPQSSVHSMLEKHHRSSFSICSLVLPFFDAFLWIPKHGQKIPKQFSNNFIGFLLICLRYYTSFSERRDAICTETKYNEL